MGGVVSAGRQVSEHTDSKEAASARNSAESRLKTCRLRDDYSSGVMSIVSTASPASSCGGL